MSIHTVLNRFFLLVALLFVATTASASSHDNFEDYRTPGTNTYTIPSKGDYAKIDTSLSQEIHKVFKTGWRNEQVELAEMIASNPGHVNPADLFIAGRYFLLLKDFRQAATLTVNAYFRLAIDIRISQDESLSDTMMEWQMKLSEACAGLTEKELETFAECRIEAADNFEEWDRRTPRNYDCNWIRLHSIRTFYESTFDEIDQSAKQRIVERFYRELKGESSEEDAADASPEDPFFFNVSDRTFTCKHSGLSFTLPQEVTPLINPFGKYSTHFILPNGSISLWINTTILSSVAESEVIEVCTIGEGMQASKKRITNLTNPESPTAIGIHYTVVGGPYDLDMELQCGADEEVEYMRYLQAILNSMKFSISN